MITVTVYIPTNESGVTGHPSVEIDGVHQDDITINAVELLAHTSAIKRLRIENPGKFDSVFMIKTYRNKELDIICYPHYKIENNAPTDGVGDYKTELLKTQIKESAGIEDE